MDDIRVIIEPYEKHRICNALFLKGYWLKSSVMVRLNPGENKHTIYTFAYHFTFLR